MLKCGNMRREFTEPFSRESAVETLTLSRHGHFIVDTKERVYSILNELRKKKDATTMLEVTVDNFAEILVQLVKAAYNQDETMDFVISCNDGVNIPVHRYAYKSFIAYDSFAYGLTVYRAMLDMFWATKTKLNKQEIAVDFSSKVSHLFMSAIMCTALDYLVFYVFPTLKSDLNRLISSTHEHLIIVVSSHQFTTH